MVLFSHCAGHPITHLRTDSWQYAVMILLQRLSYVSVYGFFLLSGVKLTLPRSRPIQWSKWWGSRVKTLLLPYLAANVIYYSFYCWGIRWYTPSLKAFLSYLLHGNLVSPFYFLIVMFQFTLLAPLLKKTAERIHPAVALPAALVISWCSELYLSRLVAMVIPGYYYPWSDRTVTTYLVYYLAGCYIGKSYEGFVSWLKKRSVFITLLFGLTAGTNLFLFYRLKVLGVDSPLVPYAHLLYLSAAILFCFLLAALLDRPLPRLPARVEQAGFLIYLYHSILITALEWLAGRLSITDVGLLFCIRVPLIYIGTPILCILWQELVRLLSTSIKHREVQPK